MPDPIPRFDPRGESGRRELTRADYERQNGRIDDKAFYSSGPWRKLRARTLAREPRCVRCLARGRVALARQVHHVIPRKVEPSRALDPTNVVGLCDRCHPEAEAEAQARAKGALPTLDDLLRRRLT